MGDEQYKKTLRYLLFFVGLFSLAYAYRAEKLTPCMNGGYFSVYKGEYGIPDIPIFDCPDGIYPYKCMLMVEIPRNICN
ncbi:MAG: hypothetical protein JXA82_12130 [Sedimentisphaerales bacterium]|nr:hypothetical protein [Sedimentisphaerales bacterium]